MSAVAGLATTLGDQGVRAMGAKGFEQPVDLAALQTHQRRGVLNAGPAVGQIDHHTQPAELCAAHRNHRHPPSPSAPQPKGRVVPSPSVRPAVIYINFAPKIYYQKSCPPFNVRGLRSLGSRDAVACGPPRTAPSRSGADWWPRPCPYADPARGRTTPPGRPPGCPGRPAPQRRCGRRRRCRRR